MKLTQKIYFGLAIPGVILVCIGAYSLYAFSRIEEQVRTIYDDRVIPLQQLKVISDSYAVSVVDAVNKANEDLLSPQIALESVTDARETIENTWDAYLATELTPAEAQLAQEAEELFDLANQEIDQLVQVLRTGNSDAIAQFDGELYQVIDPLSAKIQELIELQLEVAGEERQEAERVYNSIVTLFLILLGLAVILASPVGFFLSRAVTAALQELTNSVATASHQIATATEEQERVAEQQAVSVNETTTTMEELRTSAQQLAEQAQLGASEAQEALSLTENGSNNVNQTLEELETLKEKVNAIAEQILHLSEQAGQIGSISSLVGDLANQTNMLALNAAVEAVRAGEEGKGFGVVATEIRKLADQSRKSAENISNLVQDVQSAIDSTVVTTKAGTQSVENGLVVGQKTVQSFQGIADSVNNVVMVNQQISLNIQQQTTAIMQVTDAMNSLNQSAQENASGISQTKVGTQNLNKVALDLQTTI